MPFRLRDGLKGADMTAATIQDVSAFTERESVFWYFVGAIHSAARSVFTWFFLPFFLLGAILLAQVYPSRILAALRRVNAVLPNIQDPDELILLRDILRLAYGAGRFYRRLCLFRGSMQLAMEELDDTIDSLNLVLGSEDDLRSFLKTSESRRSPALPFEFENNTHRITTI